MFPNSISAYQCYSSSHGLTELKVQLENPATKRLMVTNPARELILLEERKFMFTIINMDSKGRTIMKRIMGSDLPTGCIGLDDMETEDWDFLKYRAGAIHSNKIDKLKQAIQLCREAMSINHISDSSSCPKIRVIDKAIKLSGDLCPLPHFLMYELHYMYILQRFGSNDLSLILKSSPRQRWVTDSFDKAVASLEKGLQAGKNFVGLVNAHQSFRGNFYSWVPTRWLVRCTYALGSLFHQAGRLKEADAMLKICLGYDIHDKLGARHRLLLVSLERGGESKGENSTSLGSRHIRQLLKSKFGNDEDIDDVFAIWNYTRALNSFVVKGDCTKSYDLLVFAIDTNPHVPPVLLAWEMLLQDKSLIPIGSELEASMYAMDYSTFWENVEGALEWLEKVYCGYLDIRRTPVSPLIQNAFITGTKLYNQGINLPYGSTSEKKLVFNKACEQFAFAIASSSNGGDGDNKIYSKSLYRLALCKRSLGDKATAIKNCTIVLALKGVSVDQRKHALYTRANCYEEIGELRKALADWKYVLVNIGMFDTAEDGVIRVEKRLNITSSYRSHEIPDNMRRDADIVGQELLKLANKCNITGEPAYAVSMSSCDYCHRGGVKLKRCSKCLKVSYCGADCQRAAWKAGHKKSCSTK